MKKTLLAGIVLLLLGLGFLSTIEIESPVLGRTVLRMASEETGIALRAARFRMSLWRGLALDEVRASSSFLGNRYSVDVHGLVFEHRVLPLLAGEFIATRVVIDRPRIQIKRPEPRPSEARESSSSAPARAGSENAGSPSGWERFVVALVPAGSITLAIEDFVLRDAAIQSLDGTSVRGLGLSLSDLQYDGRALTPMHALRASGGIELGELQLESIRVRELEGDISISNAKLDLLDVDFSSDYGPFQGKGSLDFNTIPFRYHLTLLGEPLDLGRLIGRGWRGFGSGALRLDAEGFGTSAMRFRGDGTLTLGGGTLPRSRLLEALAAAVGEEAVVGSAYAATEAAFHVENGRLSLAPFEIDTERFGFDLEGSVRLDGPLDLRLTWRTSLEGLDLEGVSAESLRAIADGTGSVAIPYLVSGSLGDPRIELDSRALVPTPQR